MTPIEQRFVEQVTLNEMNATLLERLPSLGLPQCYLTAGCLFQSVWNAICQQPPQTSIKDYDVFYFDDTDLSWEGENARIEKVKGLFSDLEISVEVKNQARVHLWYEERFGKGYPRLQSSRDGIDRYLITCTCVGINVVDCRLYAPNGLKDIYGGTLKMNPKNARPELFFAKATDYKRRWPWLKIEGEGIQCF